MSRSALVIIDMINPFDFPNGRQVLRAAKGIAETIQSLVRDHRRRGAPCIYVNDNFGHWQSDFPTLVSEVSQSRGASVLDLVRPTAKDFFILKPKHSAFFQTPLPFLLESLQITSITLCGIETDSCVMASALDAHMRELDVHVPSNATASSSPARQRAAMLLLRHNKIATRPWK